MADTPASDPLRTLRPFWARDFNRASQAVLDLGILIGSFVVAWLLRLEFDLRGHTPAVFAQLPVVVTVQVVLLYVSGIPAFVWRYVGLAELHSFLAAAIGSALPLLLLRLGLPDSFQLFRVPISVIVIDSGLAFGGLLGARVLRRLLYERAEKTRGAVKRRGRPILVVGAGRAGVMVAKEIQGRGDLGLVPIGFVDDDADKLGSVIQGLRVLGTTADLPRLVREHQVDHVVLAIADASRPQLRRIVELCEAVPVRARIVPGLYEILDGRVSFSRLRDVEIEDLLGREPVRLDAGLLRDFLDGKRVMVTGAGGSIGSELARQIAAFSVAELILVERAEAGLFDIDRELRSRPEPIRVATVVGDVGDVRRMEGVFAEYRPQVVFHAAAHKHVPLMESNPGEAIKNNVVGTHRLSELAARTGVDVFVLISTDKAIRPTSVMGATKRVAELVIQARAARSATRFVAVRFGNVLGSAGSVVPIFRQQIAAGGPVTVTHPEVSRYFMTIPEAAQLVLEAGVIGRSGEILILDMGEPIRIVDLARHMITLSGLKPGDDVEIQFTGLRPGEKLHEELALSGENVAPTLHPKIGVGKLEPYPPERIDQAVRELEALAAAGRDEEIRAALAALLPEASLASTVTV